MYGLSKSKGKISLSIQPSLMVSIPLCSKLELLSKLICTISVKFAVMLVSDANGKLFSTISRLSMSHLT